MFPKKGVEHLSCPDMVGSPSVTCKRCAYGGGASSLLLEEPLRLPVR
jgi:hypothetical protein